MRLCFLVLLFPTLSCPFPLPLSLLFLGTFAVLFIISLFFANFASLKAILGKKKKPSTWYIPRFLRMAFWLCFSGPLEVSFAFDVCVCGVDRGINDCMNFPSS